MKTTTTLENNNVTNEEKLLVLLAEKNEKIAKMEVELEWFKQKMAAMNKSKFGSTSEKVIDGQLNLFNEIEEFVDVTVLEPEVTKKKTKNRKMKEADFSKLPSETIHHELDNLDCNGCSTKMKELALVLCQENGQLKFRVIPKLMVQCVIYFCLKFRGGQIPTSPVNSNGIIKRFYVFEDNRLSMVNVGDFVKINPFSFNKCVK